MEQVGSFWQSAIPQSGRWLLVFAVVASGTVWGIGYLDWPARSRYRVEMGLRTAFNLLLFMAGLVLLYHGMRIGNLGKVLGELHGLYLSGGYDHGPVSSESELSALASLSSHALLSGALALVLTVAGIALQLRRRRLAGMAPAQPDASASASPRS